MDDLSNVWRHLAVTMDGDVAVISVRGDISAGDWHDELHAVFEHLILISCHRVVMDMTGVARASSFLVACIGFYARVLAEAGGLLVVAALTENCEKPFRLAGIDRMLIKQPTRAEAIATATNI